MTTQNEALRLADLLKERYGATVPTSQAAAELRRLQNENEELRKDAERMDWVAKNGLFCVDSVTGEVGGNCRIHMAASRKNIDTAITKSKGGV